MDFAEYRAALLGLATVRLYTNALFVENIAWYQRRGYQIERIEERSDRRALHLTRQLLPLCSAPLNRREHSAPIAKVRPADVFARLHRRTQPRRLTRIGSAI